MVTVLSWTEPPKSYASPEPGEEDAGVPSVDDWRWADVDADPILNLNLAREIEGWATKELMRMSAIARRILYTKEAIA